tara:strand:- start:376 stop:1128 length:753 start_codon:yes stop_codon:yes gene_type:complete
MKISSILQYSTIDYRFLECNLRQLSKVSGEIIVPICTSLFNGQPEDEYKLQKSIELIKSYPNTRYILFKHIPTQTPRYHHNLSRKIGTDNAIYDWVLFVDADEIISDDFLCWFNSIKHTNNSYWFTCYWYFRSPCYQAKQTEGAGLLTKKCYCNWNLNSNQERQQLFNLLPNFHNGDMGNVLSLSKTPLVHHFSWVRTKEEMLSKVKNWGHSNDTIDWVKLVNDEFTNSFNGTDFVHGYKYNIIENKFKL